ncbi:MAG: glycosyltransferase family 4 protein [Candidatus Nealsonbacteria bacterium]
MKIVQIATFEESIPPKKYGGVELVVYNIIQELIKRGHQVSLIASGDSKTKARLLPIFPKALRIYPEAQNIKTRDSLKFIGVGKVLEHLKNIDVDIIHNHLGWRLLAFSPIIETPIVTTLHGPLYPAYQKLVYGKFKKNNYVSISKNQREPFPDLNYVGNVYNGIDTSIFPFNKTPKNYLAFLGRMSPEKGPIEAIKIAKKAKMELIMAAKVDIVDKKYFEEQVKPLIDGKQIKFIGEVNHKGKIKLLKNAKALIAPIQWREPFGLFLIEPMACGTPTIVFNRGSAKEIVKDGKTGFVVKNINEAVAAIKKIDQIDRKECQKHVEKNFSIEKMTDGYEKIYNDILKKKNEML